MAFWEKKTCIYRKKNVCCELLARLNGCFISGYLTAVIFFCGFEWFVIDFIEGSIIYFPACFPCVFHVTSKNTTLGIWKNYDSIHISKIRRGFRHESLLGYYKFFMQIKKEIQMYKR